MSFAAKVFRKLPESHGLSRYPPDVRSGEKNIDAVIVATPDHNHAIIQMRGPRPKKHVYSAKPLTHTLHECAP